MMSPLLSRMHQRRDAVERALIHHQVQYSPPEGPGGRTTWVIQTGTGAKTATLVQAEWYCQGLADKER
jgi:hypothetical protein